MTEGERRGFTLIELVLTITILGIIAAVSIPTLVNLGSNNAEVAARKLVSDLSYARRLAQSRNSIYGVSFDAAAETYTLYLYDPVADTKTTATDPLTASPMVVDLKTMSGLQVADIQNPNFKGGLDVRFTPQGIPQDVNNTALTNAGSVVFASAGVARTVTVQPNTGEVSYQ